MRYLLGLIFRLSGSSIVFSKWWHQFTHLQCKNALFLPQRFLHWSAVLLITANWCEVVFFIVVLICSSLMISDDDSFSYPVGQQSVLYNVSAHICPKVGVFFYEVLMVIYLFVYVLQSWASDPVLMAIGHDLYMAHAFLLSQIPGSVWVIYLYISDINPCLMHKSLFPFGLVAFSFVYVFPWCTKAFQFNVVPIVYLYFHLPSVGVKFPITSLVLMSWNISWYYLQST